jgi:hypothetical protein
VIEHHRVRAEHPGIAEDAADIVMIGNAAGDHDSAFSGSPERNSPSDGGGM